MCYGTVISLAILDVRIVTDASGRQAMDHSYDVIESSHNLIVHGQFMPFEHCSGLDLHVRNSMLNPRVVKVRGAHCQFVTFESNVENNWYQQTSTLKALAEWCFHCAPTVVPTVPRAPYPCMPTAPTDDEVATESGPNSVECQICQETVRHPVLRTHIGQRILRGHHIEGQAGRSCANISRFCGSRDECTICLPLQTRSTHTRMVVAVSSCPLQLSAICWSRMSIATKANPCTNRLVNCPQCTTTVWLYSMAAHFAATHPNDPIPHGLRVTEEEEASVRGWNINALKSGKKQQKVACDMPTPSIIPFTNTSANCYSSSSSSSSSPSSSSSSSSPSTAPPKPPTTSHTSSMPPSESAATTEGDCQTRPLKSCSFQRTKILP